MEDTTRKKAREEKSDISRNDDATQSDENTLHSNYILHYDILRIVFQYLNGRDLSNASMVCRSWSEAANKEKSRRGPCHCRIDPEKVDSLLSYIKNVRIKPLAGFFFAPCCFKNYEGVEDYVRNVLREHCEIIILYTDDVFMDYNMRFNEDMICAFLPQIPNVRIESYKVTENFMETWNIINENVIREISMLNDKTSTCFMIFYNYVGGAKKFFSVIQRRKTFKISSISAIQLLDIYVPYKTSQKTKTCKVCYPMDEPNCIAVVITGPIETWSVILKKRCNTQEHIEARLQLFKDEVKLKKHSIGFMFSCTSDRYNEKAEMALTIFKRLFPKISLSVGCLVYDIDHKNFEKTTDEVNEEKNDKDDHKCKIFQFRSMDMCIMFLILTYG